MIFEVNIKKNLGFEGAIEYRAEVREIGRSHEDTFCATDETPGLAFGNALADLLFDRAETDR